MMTSIVNRSQQETRLIQGLSLSDSSVQGMLNAQYLRFA